MNKQKMAINTWRRLIFAQDQNGNLLPGALSLPTIRKMIENDDIPGERIGSKYFVFVDARGELINSDPLVNKVLAG